MQRHSRWAKDAVCIFTATPSVLPDSKISSTSNQQSKAAAMAAPCMVTATHTLKLCMRTQEASYTLQPVHDVNNVLRPTTNRTEEYTITVCNYASTTYTIHMYACYCEVLTLQSVTLKSATSAASGFCRLPCWSYSSAGHRTFTLGTMSTPPRE